MQRSENIKSRVSFVEIILKYLLTIKNISETDIFRCARVRVRA